MTTQSAPTKQSLAVFEEYKQAINQSLAEYFQELPKLFASYNLPSIATKSLEMIAEFTQRPGKRVRGALAAMAYDHSANQYLSANGLQLAVAMELVQTCALMEDDVTDRSDFRRGEPTAHRLYEHYDKRISVRDAEQIAFYTANISLDIANYTGLNITENPANTSKAVAYLQKNFILTTFGQLDDIMQEIGREATTADIIRKYLLKTSHYTFVNPLQAGMALAGIKDEAAYTQVERFGQAAGVAFQTHDDYLGIFGGDETGKPNVDDIKEGKLTVLTQYVFDHGSKADVAKLQKYLGNPSIGEQELAEVRALLDKTGATMEARRVAKEYADKAIQALQAVTIWDDTFKSRLAELITYSIERKS